MAIEISPADVARAETFIASMLTENVPTGRYSEGTALRDLAVKGFAFIYAHLQKENEQIRALQSLLNVQSVSTSTDPNVDRTVTVATDAILSNWFITRNVGEFSRGLLSVVVSRKQDYVIKRNYRFQYDQRLFFYPDTEETGEDLVIRSRDLTTVLGGNGSVEGYQFNIRIVAAKTGAAYNVNPTTWLSANFSPFVLRAFNSEKFTEGGNKESTANLISRSGTAIAVRNLINDRSIDATLRDKFSSIKRLYVVGMGAPEMQRDVALRFGPESSLHVGGYYDIYVEMPLTQKTFEGLVGGAFERPDGKATVFKDVNVPDWTVTDVRVGDAIKIAAGLPEAPRDFVIRQILPNELRVSETHPFSKATDLDGTFVEYFIYRPLFGANWQVLPVSGVNVQGQTSAKVQNANRLLLPAGPHYDITDIAVLDPDSGDTAINATDGYVHFTKRVNAAPTPITATSEEFEYQVHTPFPETAQSQEVFSELILPTGPLGYEGKTVRVQYETLAGFATVHNFTRDRFERVLAGNPLVKGYHPVYLNFRLQYNLKPTASNVIDENALQEHLWNFINTFPPSDIIDTSDIVAEARAFDSNMGAVFPLTIYYDAILPDGRMISYATQDAVSLDPSKLLPEFANALNNPEQISISDATVRYITTKSRITIEQV